MESVPVAQVISTVLSMEGSLTDEQGFRRAMGSFPSPVAIVTALDADGQPRGFTCSAVCSVSMAPPSMLVCVNRRNGSLDAIRDSGGFVVNLLREGTHATSELFASPSPHKFAGVRWRPTEESGLPLLADDIAAFVECTLHAEIIAGTHAILIGLVRSSGRAPRDGGPLVYYDRTYGRWAKAG
jgi:flavin reductase (DIM6/NTAB) family NADH-FMN oxidoreductase RutF